MLRRSVLLSIVVSLMTAVPAAAEDPPFVEWSSLLPGLATTFEVRLHIPTTEHVGRRERLLDRRYQRGPREIVA